MGAFNAITCERVHAAIRSVCGASDGYSLIINAGVRLLQHATKRWLTALALIRMAMTAAAAAQSPSSGGAPLHSPDAAGERESRSSVGNFTPLPFSTAARSPIASAPAAGGGAAHSLQSVDFATVQTEVDASVALVASTVSFLYAFLVCGSAVSGVEPQGIAGGGSSGGDQGAASSAGSSATESFCEAIGASKRGDIRAACPLSSQSCIHFVALLYEILTLHWHSPPSPSIPFSPSSPFQPTANRSRLSRSCVAAWTSFMPQPLRTSS